MAELMLDVGGAADPAPRSTSRSTAWRVFRRDRIAMVSLVTVLVLVAAALISVVWTPYDYADQDLSIRLDGPSWAHPFGTDDYGRDVLSRLMVGARVSLAVGILSVALTMIVGVGIGLVAGYRRRLDNVLMRMIDMLLSIPGLFLLLLLVSLFGRGTWRTVLFIGLTSWMPTSRLIRGEVLSLRERDFVAASEGFGARTWWVLRRHLLINVADVMLVNATLTISLVILLESGLSYLGLGAQAPLPSWGNMLSSGRDYMRDAWWVTTFPGLAVFVTVLAFNFIGDGLRDAVDVRR